jgi:hypothetical protein
LDLDGTFTQDAGAVVFNEAGADYDFRIEGVGEANALFVQGSDGKVGIGTASPIPNCRLTVAGASIGVTGADTNWTEGGQRAFMDIHDNNARLGSAAGGGAAMGLQVVSNGAVRMTIDSGGDVTFTGDLKINNANYAVEGYGTGRNVLRSLRLKLENATTAGNYVKATTFNKFNHTPIAEADDVLLGTPKTNFSYPLAWVFDILVAGLEGNCIGVLSASVQENQSGTALTVVGDVNSNGIRVSLLNAASAAGADIDSLVDTGQISIQVLYVTSS